MIKATFSMRDEILSALMAAPDQLASTNQFGAPVRSYGMDRLSAGGAAQLRGVTEPYFLTRLSDHGVPMFHLRAEELTHDLKSA